MKIKCPAGCGEFDSTIVNHQSELDVHINNNHEDSTRMLCDLLVKIHEKIESLEKEPYHPLDVKQLEGKHWLKPEDMPEICFVCIGHQQTIEELKSLLESEK